MSYTEITFQVPVHDEAKEVMAHVDLETGKVTNIYTYRTGLEGRFLGTTWKSGWKEGWKGGSKTVYRPGKNPLFKYAVNIDAAWKQIQKRALFFEDTMKEAGVAAYGK